MRGTSGGKVAKESRLRLPKRGETRSLVVEFEKQRDARSLDEWLRLLRRGGLDELMERIVETLAARVRDLVPSLFQGEYGGRCDEEDRQAGSTSRR
jgi:hypothetical protein